MVRAAPMRKLLCRVLPLLLAGACAGSSPLTSSPSGQGPTSTQTARAAAKEVELKEVLARAEREHGRDHPDVAQSLNNLALLYVRQGRYAEAEPLHRRALAIREKALGRDHPDVAQSLNNLALLYVAQGRYTE